MRFSALLLTLIGVIWCNALSAQEASGTGKGFMVGAGLVTCLELTNYTNEYEVPADLLPWVKGFWSGMNLSRGVDGDKDVDLSVPVAADSVVQARIYSECYADSDRRVYSVAMQMYFEFPAISVTE